MNFEFQNISLNLKVIFMAKNNVIAFVFETCHSWVAIAVHKYLIAINFILEPVLICI